MTSHLISNIRRVLKVVLFPLGDSQASEFHLTTFRHTLSVPSAQVVLRTKNNREVIYLYKYRSYNAPVNLPAYTTYEYGTECSETSAYKIQTPGNHPKQRKQQSSSDMGFFTGEMFVLQSGRPYSCR